MSADTLTKTKQQTRTPPRYKVLLLNDDYTPMDFVVFVLVRYFHKSEVEALAIMQEAHDKGVSIAGVYSFEVAETKVRQVMGVSRKEAYPLRVSLEPE